MTVDFYQRTKVTKGIGSETVNSGDDVKLSCQVKFHRFTKKTQQFEIHYTRSGASINNLLHWAWIQYQAARLELRTRSCKRSGTVFKSLLCWLAGEVSWLAVEVLSSCQK